MLLLLGTTAIAAFPLSHANRADAQVLIGGQAPAGDGGSDGIGDADADPGIPGPIVAPHIYSGPPISTVTTAYKGDARGGNGGAGGTAVDVEFTGPIPTSVSLDGGNGGQGGVGGTIDITDASSLQTSGNTGGGVDAYGMHATADGGNGGNAGWAFYVSLPGFSPDAGNGGNGGNGGTARATNASGASILTVGTNAHGIVVTADGGTGGNGGLGANVTPGEGEGGNGGVGGNGGQAYGTNLGTVTTQGTGAKGMLVRAAGGVGGNGGDGFGVVGSGGNGGGATLGGRAEGVNGAGGVIETFGDFAIGMTVQSIGGGGGSGAEGYGLAGGGGAGRDGNNGGEAIGTNTGSITTRGAGSIGMLVESIGGGGGDGGGAVAGVAIGGSGAGGGHGGTARGFLGGTIRTGVDGSGDGAIGVLVQSVGGGGGNGGFALALPVNPIAVGVGGSAGAGSNGGFVEVLQAFDGGNAVPLVVETNGFGAAGVVAQSVGGGGGNGGTAVAATIAAAVAVGGDGAGGGDAGQVRYDVGNARIDTYGNSSIGLLVQGVGGGGGNGAMALSVSGAVSVGVGGSGAGGGNGFTGDYDENRIDVSATHGGAITTRGAISHGMVVQSVGGGGGNGGFSLALSAAASVGVGGGGATGGDGGNVVARAGGTINTNGFFSHGLIAQSIGGGGGNGGGSVSGGLGVNVGVGGDGAAGGRGGRVEVYNSAGITTGSLTGPQNGLFSHAIFAQSLGGGGGSGGFSIAAGLGPAVSVAGSGDGGGSGSRVYVENQGNLTTVGAFSVGLFAQSVGGGGGDGGFSLGAGTTLGISIGGSGADGGDGGVVDVRNASSISTYGAMSHGMLVQSVGGGGGSGGNTVGAAVGLAAVTVTVGGGGGGGGSGNNVSVDHAGDITVRGPSAKAILAQSVGGNGGNGGEAWSFAAGANVYPYPSGSIGVAVGGAGGGGGNAGTVSVTADGNMVSDSYQEGSGGIVAQSIGGRGGNGGRSTTVNGSFSPTVSVNLGVAVGGKGGGGGQGNTVTVNTGLESASVIRTTGHNAHGILAQSVGGGGGNGGDATALTGGLGGTVTVNATVTVGGWGGDGNSGGTVNVTNAAQIQTAGTQSNAILAQSIGGGGGAGGSSSGTTASVSTGSNVNVNANVSIGGQGGDGNNGGAVTVTNSGRLDTGGDFSAGIYAQSVGGGGGVGGSADAKTFDVGSSEGTTIDVNLAIGGGGGSGGGDRDQDGTSNQDEWDDFVLEGLSNGMQVTVDNSGDITTRGFGSAGIVAQSVGGGGGSGGAATAGNEGKQDGKALVSVGAGIGLGGGNAGNGGVVDVTNRATITTYGEDSNGITASSVGAAGGIGGAASSGVEAEYAIGGSIGGFGGAGGVGQAVTVRNLASGTIRTYGDRSIGILAQSIGGGGGSGGAGKSAGDGETVAVTLSVGGFADSAGRGGDVIVENAGVITTGSVILDIDGNIVSRPGGANAHGILAQSIGGGGGLGGASGTSTGESDIGIGLNLSGIGGKGGIGGSVTVTNASTGRIATFGDNSYGIFAQSVGGGGGTAGAGTTEAEGGDVSVNVKMGGTGGGGATGGTVRVTNSGQIDTWGALSHGIFAQSIGGGGGASGSASNAADADMNIGVQLSQPAGSAADGGKVYVDHRDGARIETRGDGAIGIFAQSVGGSGGYGGTVTEESGNDSFTAMLGASGGAGGMGEYVEVKVTGDIVTHGRLAHGVVAQSVGGGGGYGSDASGNASALGIGLGGAGGNGGNGGNVLVERTGAITTLGEDSIAIIAQSIGGGGGFAGTSFGRFATDDNGGGPSSVAFTLRGGSTGESGTVTIIQDGAIETAGARSHGIVAQVVAGGGGAGGGVGSAGGNTTGAGSAGGAGNAGAASATAMDQVRVSGSESYALFGQSAAGNGNSGNVNLVAQSSLLAQGAGSVAAYGESTASGSKGNIAIDLRGAYTVGGGGTGVAAMLVGGTDNALNNNSLLYAMGQEYDFQLPQFATLAAIEPAPINAILESLLDDFSPLAITGTSGNDTVNNQRTGTTLGRVIGNIDLGGGTNSFNNFETSSMVALDSIDLGGGLFSNRGRFTMNGIGFLKGVPVTIDGAFTQTAAGEYVVDIDLTPDTNDAIAMSGDGDFAGVATVNFLSIDRLMDENVIATTSGGSMTTTMVGQFTGPAIGFNFLTRAEGGNLILFADNPTFEDLIDDPQSGVSDPGAVQMARYFDALEQVQALYDAPSELARLINMLRGLESYEEFGETMMRLTPHYAVHAFEMTNRQAEMMQDAASNCLETPDALGAKDRCVWASLTPNAWYDRDTGPGTSTRSDNYANFSAGAIGRWNENWSFGAMVGRTEFDSEIAFNDAVLSTAEGSGWQVNGLAKYENGSYFADFLVGGGMARFDGERDTTVAPLAYVPGETLGGEYLPDAFHEGIGNRVTFNQDTAQFGASVGLGYNYRVGSFYANPQVRFDARWLTASGEEKGSVAAFTFDGSDSTYYSATPGLVIGADIPVSETTSVRLTAEGGVEFSNADWEIEGEFTAAQGLGAPPLTLVQSVDSPLYRVGAGFELNSTKGLGIAVEYDGAFGEAVNLQSFSANLKVGF
jgi:hypothetical protein